MSAPSQASSDGSYTQVQAAAAFLADRLPLRTAPAVGIVLGSGLGALADEVERDGGAALETAAIPHFPTSSVEGHRGRFVVGALGGTPVAVLQGRVHRYEGYTARQVAFPIRVLLALGVRRFLLTNAAGGVSAELAAGDLMLLTDHLNLTGDSPLLGPNDVRFGPRFPDMTEAYSKKLRAHAHAAAGEAGTTLKEGVYAGLLGPSYETPAEVRMLRALGAHAVGMSTVYEVLAARHAGADVVALSCITNLAAGASDTPLTHDEVQETARRSARVFGAVVRALAPRLASA